MTSSIWEDLCAPKAGRIHELDQHTPLYLDWYIAVKVLGMLYSEYVQRTTPAERLLNQLGLGLEAAKDAHERWHLEQERDTEDAAPTHYDPRMAQT